MEENQKYLRESQLAERWGFTTATLAKWRRDKTGNVPDHYCFNGRDCVYKLDDVRAPQSPKVGEQALSPQSNIV